MNYIKDHIPKSKEKRPGTKMSAASITIHNTGNPTSTARNERGWLTNPLNKNYASWHIVVDEKEAIEAIPLNEIAYHAGNSTGNATSIGIEVCESVNQAAVWQNAVSLVAKMLQERGWGVDKVRTHQSWSGKNCPRLLLPRWNEFLGDIQKELLRLNGVKEPEKILNDVSDWAKDAQQWAIENKISDGTYPKNDLTREQAWVMLNKLYKLMGGK